MAHDTVAFFENKTDVASLDLINGAADTVHTVSGDNVTVPSNWNQILGAWATMENASDTPVNAQLSAPSMRNRTLVDIPLINNPASATFTHNIPQPYNEYLAAPVQLTPGEFLQAYMQGSGTTGTCYQTVAVFLGDGNYAIPPTMVGYPIQHVRATSATQPAADVWKALVLTMSQTLKAGAYAAVGARIQQDTCRFARLILTDAGNANRPGCVGVNNVKTPDIAVFRNAGLGVWGLFTHTNIPQIEIFSQTTDTAANGKFTLDVIQIG